MSKLGVKIAQRLVELGEISADVYDIDATEIFRHRPGHWQRSGGAWSWSLDLICKDGSIAYDSYGSQYSATECVKMTDWEFYTTGIDKGICPKGRV